MNETRKRSIVVARWNIGENIRQSLIEWNLFRSKSTNVLHVRNERVQTRLYVCLLSVSILIVIIYTSLEERAVVETINPPSNSTEYDYFRQIYPPTLECRCSRISFEYSTIIPRLEVESFHPICDSFFVSSDWSDLLLPDLYSPWYLSNQDYNQWIVPVFQLVATFCSVAQDQVNHSLMAFSSSSLVIDRLISAKQFEQQLNTIVTHLQQHIPTEFMQTVDLIRLSQQGNGLISVFSSNWQYHVKNNNRSIGADLSCQPVTYENFTCSCALSQQCSMPAFLFNEDGIAYYNVNGFRLGCTILESFLQSSFECFSSVPCISSLFYILITSRYTLNPPPVNGSDFVSPFNNSLSTFADDDTMETIVTRMFINRWQHELSYEAFFQGCAVRECTYTRHYRFDALDLITTLLSVFGGLSVVLRFLVPHLFTLVKKISHRHS